MGFGGAIGSAFLWLADKVGSNQIDKWLESESSKTIRMLQRALLESQDRRSELDGIADILAEVERQRDALQMQVIRLNVDTAALRSEILRLQLAQQKP